MPPTKDQTETQYGEGWGGDPVVELPMPSGAVCLIKRSDPIHLMDAGVLDELDTLTPFVQEKHVTRVQKGKKLKVVEQTPASDQQFVDLMKDPKTRAKMMELMNKITVTMVVKPQIHPAIAFEDRVKGLVYVDTVPLADKAAILRHAVGNVKALERFRDESVKLGGDSQPS